MGFDAIELELYVVKRVFHRVTSSKLNALFFELHQFKKISLFLAVDFSVQCRFHHRLALLVLLVVSVTPAVTPAFAPVTASASAASSVLLRLLVFRDHF